MEVIQKQWISTFSLLIVRTSLIQKQYVIKLEKDNDIRIFIIVIHI